MIFLCFNIKNRVPFVENILNHLLSFGFNVWYDRKDIFLGDNRSTMNLENGAANLNVKYAIVIISPEFSTGDYCKKELDILWKRKLRNNIHIFPIFYNCTPETIPSEYSYLLDSVCKFIMPNDETIFTVYHIVSKILYDYVSKLKNNSLNLIYKLIDDNFLKKSIRIYSSIDRNNYNSKMTIIYLMYKYIETKVDLSDIQPFFYYGFDKLYSFSKLNIETDLRELQILEYMIVLLLDKYFIKDY